MSDIFDWDAESILHLAAHNVSPEEFEQAVERYPVDLDYQVVNGEVRYLQIGTTTAASAVGRTRMATQVRKTPPATFKSPSPTKPSPTPGATNP